jgi:hypothetical protein
MSDRFGEDKNLVNADYFACPLCHLVLNSSEGMSQRGRTGRY